ncbi:MAG: ATP-binding domain-containing protein [Candidatus Eremiobacteraeota bacterium]|nr:ATP-binding domain-containing protein [Candidatus Eremiobacteraeota bacterium]
MIRSEYLDVFDSLIKGGLSGGKWEIYSDFRRQAIYSEITASDMINMLDSRAQFTRFQLTYNCRNTRPIGEETSLISGFETPPFLPNKIEGIPVEYFFYGNQREEIKSLEKILKNLKKAGIPFRNITILSPHKFDGSIASKLDSNDYSIINLFDKAVLFPRRRKITFSTIHGFKGMENSYVIIVDIDSLSEDYQKCLLYIGMSRARVGLSLLISRESRDYYRELVRKSVV